MEKEYKKSLEDEIDWKMIDQLHSATINFSSTSLEIKKLFFVLIGIAVPALIKLANDKLDISLFITLYILTITFWFLDSYTYYYQEKLREKMDLHFNELKKRHKETENPQNQFKISFTIEANRTQKTRIRRSIFNPSIRIYLLLLILNSVGLYLFYKGIIG